MRGLYALRFCLSLFLFRVLCHYSAATGYILSAFHLSDTVISILIGSTAANVIGLVAIILRDLFPTNLAQAEKADKKDQT